jgi:hypothetical protein
MSDSDSSHSDLDINIDPDVAAAYNRGPDRVVHKGKQYLWRKHRDNTRAFPSLPSSGFSGTNMRGQAIVARRGFGGVVSAKGLLCWLAGGDRARVFAT